MEIQEISRGGDGIAKIKGLVVSVLGTEVKDKLRIKINRADRSFAEEEVAGKREEKAEERKSDCSHF